MNWNGVISLLLACIESILLANVLIFNKAGKFRNIAVVMIALLAGYQFMEILICQVELQNPFFPYLAFIDITFLPPLNLLLVINLAHKPEPKNVNKLIFLPVVFFVIYYSFVIPKFTVTGCTVLYATYHYPLGDLYGLFYYLPIAISIILLIIHLRKEKDHKSKKIRKVLLFGAIFISIPPVLGFSLMFAGSYAVISAVESVMCKFAFVYAMCLGFTCLIYLRKEI